MAEKIFRKAEFGDRFPFSMDFNRDNFSFGFGRKNDFGSDSWYAIIFLNHDDIEIYELPDYDQKILNILKEYSR